MKKINIIVIFLFAVTMVILIYNFKYKKRHNILVIGDTYLKDLNIINCSSVNCDFLYNRKKYIDIIDDIRKNKYIYKKNSKVYLNKKINQSSTIIISANNEEYKTKCTKNDRIIKEYDYKLYTQILSLIKTINKISSAKVVIVGNACINNNETKKLYKNINYININEVYYNKKTLDFD